MTSDTSRPSADRMARGGLAAMTGTVVSRLVSACTVVVLVRAFGVDDFAAFSFGLAFATVFSTLSDLGLDSVVVRELAAEPDERSVVLGSALVAKTMAVVASASIGVGIAFAYDGTFRVAALVGAASILQALASTFGLVLTADLRLGVTTAIRTGGQIASSLAAVGVAVLDGGPVAALGAAVAVGFVPGLVLARLVRRTTALRLRVERARVAHLVAESVPVAASTLAIIVFARVDQLLLAVLGQSIDVATYAVAVRVVDVLNIVPISVAAVLLPAVSRLRDADSGRVRRLSSRAHRYLAAVALPAAAIAAVVGGDALRWAFGPDYGDGGGVLAVLVLAHAFAFVFVLARQILIGLGRSGELARLAWMAALTNVALNVALIPAYGAAGAAVASLIAYAVPLVVATLRSAPPDERVEPFCLAIRPLGRAGVAAAAVFVLTRFAAGALPWAAAAAVGAAAAPVALGSCRALHRSDVAELLSALRGRRA